MRLEERFVVYINGPNGNREYKICARTVDDAERYRRQSGLGQRMRVEAVLVQVTRAKYDPQELTTILLSRNPVSGETCALMGFDDHARSVRFRRRLLRSRVEKAAWHRLVAWASGIWRRPPACGRIGKQDKRN